MQDGREVVTIGIFTVVSFHHFIEESSHSVVLSRTPIFVAYHDSRSVVHKIASIFLSIVRVSNFCLLLTKSRQKKNRLNPSLFDACQTPQ